MSHPDSVTPASVHERAGQPASDASAAAAAAAAAPAVDGRAVIAPLALIFGVNERLCVKALAGIPEGQLARRILPDTNSMLWIFLHLTHTRARMLESLGDTFDTGCSALFASGHGAPENPPSFDAVKRVADTVYPRLMARLAALDREAVSAPLHGPVPPEVTTLAEQLAYYALHDSYHVGQLACSARRWDIRGSRGDLVKELSPARAPQRSRSAAPPRGARTLAA